MQYGAALKQRQQLRGGEGSKIDQNTQHGGGGCQKSGKIAGGAYGWSLWSVKKKGIKMYLPFSKAIPIIIAIYLTD